MDVVKHSVDLGDIQPYSDVQLPKVLQRLVENRKLLNLLIKHKLPFLPRWLMAPLRPLLAAGLRRRFSRINSKAEFQERFIAPALDNMLLRTQTKFSYSGLEQLDPKAGYLYLANHRDIAMDPAFANYALYLDGHQVSQIGFGDNLMQEDFVTDLIRINRGFIVERSNSGLKAKVRAAKRLSIYIRKCLEAGESIWLAQSEGRAKDGLDRTDSSLFTMLYMAWRRDVQFGYGIKSMNVVPVSISYQYDPCDVLKAEELLARQQQDGDYHKQPGEDMRSLARGINGFKGKVHLHFCPPLLDQLNSPEEVASWCDRQIITSYRLHSSNWTCWRLLHQQSTGDEDKVSELMANVTMLFDVGEDDFYDQVMLERLRDLSADIRQLVLESYANPVFSRLKYID